MDMAGMSPPSSTNHTMTTMTTTHMSMTFYWGKSTEVLFSGWPGTRTGMYVLSLVVVFVLALLVEFLSGLQGKLMKDGKKENPANKGDKNGVVEGLLQVLVHGFRVGLAYLVMLALMSFNGGIFLVAITGHIIGFFFFQKKVFGNIGDVGTSSHM